MSPPKLGTLCLLMVLAASTARAQDAGTPPGDGGSEDSTPAFTLFDDYHCPPAPACEQVDGGSWVCSDARVVRQNCGLAGANAEVHQWRDANAERARPRFQLLPSHGVIAVLGALVTTELAVIKTRSSQGCRAVADPFASRCH